MEPQSESDDFQNLFQQFSTNEDKFGLQQAYNATQEEILTLERQKISELEKKLTRAKKAFVSLDRLYHTTVNRLKEENLKMRKENLKVLDENNELREIIKGLQSRLSQFHMITVENNEANERIHRLEEDLEVAKSQLYLQIETNNEEIASLKQKHTRELLKNKLFLKSAKTKLNRMKNLSKNLDKGLFRWPQLEVEKISRNQSNHAIENEESAIVTASNIENNENIAVSSNVQAKREKKPHQTKGTAEPERKKRKLYREEEDVVYDLP